MGKLKQQLSEGEERYHRLDSDFTTYRSSQSGKPEVKLQSEINLLTLEKVNLLFFLLPSLTPSLSPLPLQLLLPVALVPNRLCCCSHFVVPVRGRLAMVSAIFSSCFLSSPYFSLPAFSINSLQLISFAVVLHSLPTLFRSLLMQSSHHILVLTCLLFPSTFWASAAFANFSSPVTSPFQPTPHPFLL